LQRLFRARHEPSLATHSRLQAGAGGTAKARYLEKMAERGRAHLNIRLLVELTDGSRLEL